MEMLSAPSGVGVDGGVRGGTAIGVSSLESVKERHHISPRLCK